MIHRNDTKKVIKYQTTLYQVVFDNIYIKCAVFILFLFLLLQPVAPAFAALDEAVTSPEEAFVSPIFPDPEIVALEPLIPAEPSILSPETNTETAEIALEVPVAEVLPTAVQETSSSTGVTQDSEGLSTDGVMATSSATLIEEFISDLNTTTTTQTVEIGSEISEPTAIATTSETTVTPEILTLTVEQPVVEEVSSTTTPLQQSSSTEAVFGRPAKAFEFDTKECASVGDGAYYCSTPKDTIDPMEDGVFALPDKEGDLEIYVRLSGKENKLTDNSVDDSAPYFDTISKRIVWHTSINDRYQIVSYDTKTTETTLITKTTYNNMEPVAYGDITLWQSWIGNNWEIMMYDGQAVVQLTNNTLQDVSPHMREGYVVWQTQFSDGWKVAVYDQKTKTIEYITSESGLKVENPRFVLVYDSTNEQGDVQTVGYDFDSKQSFALGSLPAQVPEELPEPDQTGETRALIQNKQVSREGDAEVVDVPVPSGDTGTTTGSSSPLTLDLSSGTTTVTLVESSTALVVDVEIPSYTSTTTVSQGSIVIPDLVIPPLTATTTE